VIESVAKEHGFAPWKNSNGQIIGWKIPASGQATASVLIMHGNAGCALSRDYIAQPIHDASSADVYVLEYPGYGARAGSPSKTSMAGAAEEALRLMPSGLPKYLVSESIGAGVTAELAKNHPTEVAGMVMFVPYHNLAAVAQRHFYFLPTYFLLLDRFNPEQCLKSYHGPIKFVVAEKDEIVGSATGERLSVSYAGPKDVQIIPDAGHNDVSAQPAEWWANVFAFWHKAKS
jgi:pimeloyl-ACP methyl ester carboxylesterase